MNNTSATTPATGGQRDIAAYRRGRRPRHPRLRPRHPLDRCGNPRCTEAGNAAEPPPADLTLAVQF